MNESDELKLRAGHFVGTASILLIVGVYFIGIITGSKDATREVEARINAEHQKAIEDAVACKLSLALTQARLQRFEQVESEQLQSCCTEK